jgi:hypothetical protein
MNEARLRMTRIPKGADLVLNKVSGAPGFWIGNVIVMAGVPSIMQAMLDEVAPKLKTSVRMLSETVRADAREGDIGAQLGEIAKANPKVVIGSYPFFDPQHGPNTNVVLRAAMHRSSRLPNARSRTCWSGCGGHNRGAADGVLMVVVCTENLILTDYVIESPTRRHQARSNPATGKFKSSHKRLNPASTGLGGAGFLLPPVAPFESVSGPFWDVGLRVSEGRLLRER